MREVERMTTRSYLDALTPGMRAKLDPLSRMARENRAAPWFSVMKDEPDAAPAKYSPGTSDRFKRRQELRARVADF